MADKNEIIAAIEKLKTYEYEGERPIAVVGPKYGDPDAPDKHLRVYAFGGLIGAVPTVGSDGKFQLADENYAQYLDERERREFQSMLVNRTAETFFSSRYIELILKAAYQRSAKDTGYERKIENSIMCRSMNTASQSWAAVDMEFTVGRESGRNDIVFYDASDAPSYIITELKYNCGSTDNLGDHITKMAKMYSIRDKVRNELNRRMEYLCEYGLVGQTVRDRFIASDKNKTDIRFGILYVKGGEKEAENNVRSEGRDSFRKLESEMKKLYCYQYRDLSDDIDIDEMKQTPLADIMV